VAHTGALIALAGALMLVTYLTAILAFPKADGRIIFGDATHHFVQLRSIVFDHDLDFRNEYVRMYGLTGGEEGTEWIFTDLTSTGHVRNYTPIGPAILWAPLYLLVAAVEFGRARLGLGPSPDGFGRAFQLVPGITGVLAATAATYFAWRFARRFVDDASAAAATWTVWLGSHALYYSLVSPSYSHAPSMLTAAVFFLVWIATRDAPSMGRFLLWGALAGACALMRWQDALFLLVPFIDAVQWPVSWRRRAAGILVAGAGALVTFSPQMIVWRVLYGHAISLPQGPSFLQWSSPHLLDVLVSTNHGLFSWAPLLVLSVIGLALFLARHRRLAVAIGAVVVVSWYVNASVADWWAGEAFGARRFLSLYPLFVVGLAAWIAGRESVPRARPARVVVAVLLTGANALLLLQYEVAMKGLRDLAPFPANWFDMYVVRFLVPFRLLAWWRR
jgi:hypothetical protein